MAAIRRTDTKSEIELRSALHRLGYRFRKDFRVRADRIWVRPDIVFTGQHVAVFVDGCFWHSCPDHGRVPTSNTWYWAEKLEKNKSRDQLVTSSLEADGWTVQRFWEHSPIDDVLAVLCAHLEAPRS
jgi:DNA mismatch endonuclease (patch repair protein)